MKILKLLNKETKHLLNDDPVRPELSYDFRTAYDREVLVLSDNEDNAHAVICVAYNHQVPETVEELNRYGMSDFNDPNRIAVFYTVWSYTKGSGRDIVFSAVDYIKENKPWVRRFVTLSPKTEMARKFHLSNGAIVLSENIESDNYEYKNV